MQTQNRLNARKVATITKPGRYSDGGGLYLQIPRDGKRVTKSWLFRFMLAGRAREMGLGSVLTFSLAEARERARDARQQLANGIDPIAARGEGRTAAKLEAARGITFKDAAEKFLAAHEPTWKNEKHREQWTATLSTYCYPIIGALPVAAIDTALVLKILEPIWTAKPETASRVQQRIKRVLDWAKARGYRHGDNPATWGGHLDKLLPSQSKRKRTKHHPALPYADIPQFMGELRGRDGISARALEFTILCATRTNETIGARRPEIDFAAKVWTIPGERMKSGREHRVPLSDRALDILATLPRELAVLRQGVNQHIEISTSSQKEAEFVFLGGKAGHPLSNMAMLELLKGMKPGVTVHGFRSTFRDWTAETPGVNYSNIVCEAALAHAIGNATEAAYRRGDLFEKRRRLMRDWTRYCMAPPKAKATGNVTAFRAVG